MLSKRDIIVTATKTNSMINQNIESTEILSNATAQKFTIEIADRTGHTTSADLTLEEATETILENAENKARWVFINGEKFEFAGKQLRTQENVQKLQERLQALQDPAILLTGMLVGGEEQL